MGYKYTNNLIKEKSPYLLQHAHNPVNWYTWTTEAFKRAKEEDKPIFLSIGYSACHWCHVMEKESFEDEEVSKILNDHYISIKVDREERPDIDVIYMDVCHMMNGNGGWPLTIFMDAEQRPFFAGTYYPKVSAYARPGLIDILNNIINLWNNDRDKLKEAGKYALKLLNGLNEKQSSEMIKTETIKNAYYDLYNMYDKNYGGFGNSPKFPMPVYLFFLMRYYYTHKDNEVLEMVVNTLKNMYLGGIYDHIGYGFSRYSTDNKWLVPHFEKMLYDNALLAIVYSEAYQLTNEQLFFKTTNNILTYVLRDMTSPDGGFYSADDADSEGIEGNFYLWTYDEIIEVLGEKNGPSFCKKYNITPKGNFEGKSIPNLINSEYIYIDDKLREQLFQYRNKKIHPHKDDKILTSWNGLMIASLAIAGRILRNNLYIDSAKKAVNFIYKRLFNNEGRLLARYRDGESSILGYADDYAFLTWGLIELYEATFEPNYLQKALDLSEQIIKYFWDKEKGGFFLYGNDGEKLISRPKEIYDGVIPSSNSVATMNFLRLSLLTGNSELQKYANEEFETFKGEINKNPISSTYMLCAYLFATSSTREIVIVGDINSNQVKEMLNELNSRYSPHEITIIKDISNKQILKIIPSLDYYKMIGNKVTAFICSNNLCSSPIMDIEDFKKIIK